MSDLGPALRSALRKRFANVELLETHISWVLLAGELAWKIKKPVDLGFVDFTTLDRRRFFCNEELRLNRRLAPTLYREVVPITGSAGRPELRGEGDVIDFAVEMRRFPQEQMLTDVARRNELTEQHIDGMAETVAGFHQQIEGATGETSFGTPAVVWKSVCETFAAVRKHLTDGNRKHRLAELRHQIESAWQELQAVCSDRRNRGFVRECHGDMHLGNMVLLDDEVTIFDAIEFNPAFRWIDVINEVAFVVMDLERCGQPEAAWRFLNRYCEMTGDYAGLRLLPFHLACRALVRAKVSLLRAAQRDGLEEKLLTEVDALLQLADQHVRPRQPRLLLTHGLSGSGKSTISATLAERLPAVRLRSDVERKRLFDNDRYTSRATAQTYDRLRDLAGPSLRAGMSAILDATLLDHRQRELAARTADEHNARLVILDFDLPVATLRDRLQDRNGDVSDANVAVLERQRGQQEALTPSELQSVVGVPASQPTEKSVQHILQQIHPHSATSPAA